MPSTHVIEGKTLADLVMDGAARWAGAPAVKFPQFQWTYGELEGEAAMVAKGLLAHGIGPGDHVGLLLANGADFLRAFFGIALAGAVPVPLNVRYRKAELSYVIEHSDIKLLFLSADHRRHFDFESLVALILDEKKMPHSVRVVVLGSDDAAEPFVDGSTFISGGSTVSDGAMYGAACMAGIRHTGAMLYTSGTSASPKGCLLSNEALVRTATCWARRGVELGPGDSLWIPNPRFHIGALSSLLASLAVGATFLSLPHFDADAAVRMLSEEAVTAFFPVFDTVALPILEHGDAAMLRFDDVRYSFVIGNPSNIAKVKAALPHARHFNVYGMTETSGWCMFNYDDADPMDPLPGGVPLPGVAFRVMSLDGRGEAATCELGQIHVRSWCTVSAYYKDERATAEAIDADGWFNTGDIGIRLEDGSLRFHGRGGDMMKVGGENVAAVEVEHLIASHPAVRQVAVVGVPDGRLREVPAAFIETHPGAELDGDDVTEFCRDKIARFKIPRYIRFVRGDEWPMSATKIRKGDLRERLTRELGLAEEKPAAVTLLSERSSG